MPSNGSSPGTYTNEYDFSQNVLQSFSTVGAHVGPAKRGPVGQRTLTTSEKDFVRLFGQPDARMGFSHYTSIAFLGEATQFYFTRVAPGSKYGGIVCSFDGKYNSLAPWTEGLEDQSLYLFNNDYDLFVIHGTNQGAWNGDISVSLIPETRDLTSNAFWVYVYQVGQATPVEQFRVVLDYRVDGMGVQLNIQENINQRSNFIQVLVNTDSTWLQLNESFRYINTLNVGADAYPGIRLVGGDDGTTPTVSDLMNAWSLYEDVEDLEVDLLINGGQYDTDLQRYLDEIAQSRMDCMAILDVPTAQQAVSKAIQYRRGDLHIDSSYSALYTPDLFIRDDYNDLRLYVPPSGFVAAAYAATDRDFATWFAPAGMTRGKLNVKGVAQVYIQEDRDALYDNQINAIRNFTSEGVRIWGADTLQVMASALSNVNVRRLMLFIERALSKAVNYSVFDPNDELLWARLTNLCDTFLDPIVNGEGLYAKQVICDTSNNTSDTIANGDVILDVYVDPVLPAKRIKLTAIVNKTGAHVTAQ